MATPHEGWSGRALTQARTCCANLFDDDDGKAFLFNEAMQVFKDYDRNQCISETVWILHHQSISVFILDLCSYAARYGEDVCALCSANQVLLRRCGFPSRNRKLSNLTSSAVRTLRPLSSLITLLGPTLPGDIHCAHLGSIAHGQRMELSCRPVSSSSTSCISEYI